MKKSQFTRFLVVISLMASTDLYAYGVPINPYRGNGGGDCDDCRPPDVRPPTEIHDPRWKRIFKTFFFMKERLALVSPHY